MCLLSLSLFVTFVLDSEPTPPLFLSSPLSVWLCRVVVHLVSRGRCLRTWVGERGGGTTAVVWSRDSGHMKAWSSGCVMTWDDSLPLELHT